jgi:hypothetical protein
MWTILICATLTVLAWVIMVLTFFRLIIFIVSWWFFEPYYYEDEEVDNPNQKN